MAPALLAQDLSTGNAWGLAALVVLVVALAAITTRLALGNRLALVAGIPLLVVVARPRRMLL